MIEFKKEQFCSKRGASGQSKCHLCLLIEPNECRFRLKPSQLSLNEHFSSSKIFARSVYHTKSSLLCSVRGYPFLPYSLKKFYISCKYLCLPVAFQYDYLADEKYVREGKFVICKKLTTISMALFIQLSNVLNVIFE
jgi:hypothetical protein